jgi:rhodanese-related sulfurtransferase
MVVQSYHDSRVTCKERIITVCGKGGWRRAQAAQVLRDMGFERTW